MSGLAGLAYEPGFAEAMDSDPDEFIELFVKDDWKTPATEAILAMDLDDLEGISEDWEAALVAAGVPEGCDDTDEYFKAHPEALGGLREAVLAQVDDYQKICEDLELESEQIEALEHWAVSAWLAKKLAAKGEIVGGFADFHVWGRRTSGQSIAMDSVIEEITSELYLA